MSTPDEEVTKWLARLSQGEEQAAEVLWEAYFLKLVHYAQQNLGGVRRQTYDEEDVALSAMRSFYRGMAGGRFKALGNREDLWKLLVTIAAHKISAERRRQHAKKRPDCRLKGESAFEHPQEHDGAEGIGQVIGHEPTPELAGEVADACRRLLDGLGDETLRQVALWTLEGYSIEEIAAKLGCVRRTIERKLARIREKWSREREQHNERT